MNEELKFFNNRGIQRGNRGDLDDAIADFERALALDPDNAVILSNLGATLERAERYEEALQVLDRALTIEPNSVMAYSNKALVFVRLQCYRMAILNFDQALALRPTHDISTYNRGIAYLALGELANGFEDYEAGLDVPGARASLFPDFDCPQWGGWDFRHQTLLVIGEQGYGDTIMFMRYLPQVVERGGTVLLGINDALSDLYSIPGVHILQRDEELPVIDWQCPLLSLPHRLTASS